MRGLEDHLAGVSMRLTAPIECFRGAAAHGVTLVGRTQDGARAYLTLMGAAAADLPAGIEEGSIERLDGHRYRVSARGREWVIEAPRSFVHRDIAAAFYAALPPRRAPLGRRLLWRVLLAIAASRAARWWSAR